MLSASAITMPIDQYGLYVTISDVLDMHAIDDVIVQATERVAYSASLTNEKLVRGILMGWRFKSGKWLKKSIVSA